MICVMCGRDINEIGQDNCSEIPGMPLCEDCVNGDADKILSDDGWDSEY